MTESKQVREKKKKNAQKVAEKAKTTKEVKETKAVKETEKVKEVKETKVEKPVEKAEKAKEVKEVKSTKKAEPESFNWKNGTLLEKCGFIGSLFTLAGAIVCLVFEFVTPAEDWPFIWFDIFIALSFIGETITHWRLNRKIAIFTGIGGAAFLVYGLLKLFGVIAF